MAKPKLALIPSTVGGSVYSVLPSNGDGDFDFSRASAATRINAQGLIETVAVGDNRLNYPLLDGRVQTCPHLLLEGQRTNLITYSESLSLTPIKNGTFTDNFAISPDGTQNATKLTATDTDPFFYQSVSFSALSYTASIYVKGIGSSIGKDFRIVLGAQSTNPKLIIPSEWTRFEYTVTMPSGSYNAGLEIADPAVIGDEVLVWGWQVEQGSYPTSYIVSNSGSATTRLAEVCDGSGNASTFNDSEGVLMAQIGNISEDNTTTLSWAISDGSVSNAVSLYYFGVSGLYYDIFNSDGIRSGNAPMTKLQQANNNKIALKYKSQDISLFVNGFELSTNNGTLSLNGLSEVSFDYGNGGFPFYGKTKQLQYFDSALTDSELETLTSWMSFSDMAIDLNYTIQ